MMENKTELPINEKTGPPVNPPPPKKKPGGARETLYRVTVRNQLRSISIADQKANILIGINTILISIIIAILGAESTLGQLQFIAELDLNIPLMVFLVACFGSAWLAILAVRPALFPWKQEAGNKLFFIDFRKIELEEFQSYVRDLLESGDKIYDSLNTDMYLFGRTINYKFRLLRLAYTIFMSGLGGMVVSFLVIRFMT
jgi:hypothetical protein